MGKAKVLEEGTRVGWNLMFHVKRLHGYATTQSVSRETEASKRPIYVIRRFGRRVIIAFPRR